MNSKSRLLAYLTVATSLILSGCKLEVNLPQNPSLGDSVEREAPESNPPPPPDTSPAPSVQNPPPTPSVPSDLSGPPDINCQTLKPSGPIKLTSADNNRVIENLDISSDGQSAIRIDGAEGITLRNIRIRHTKAKGIEVWNSKNIRIESVSIKYVRPTYLKPADPNDDINRVNISCDYTTGFVARKIRLEDGSSGVRTTECHGAHLSFIEGHNFRGPWTTGPMVQFGRSHKSTLEDFSAENDRYNSFVEDIVSVWNSGNCIIRRGLVDGNNSPAGVGVIFEINDPGVSGGLAEDIDAVRQGNGCFAAYPANNITFRRTRCYQNICEAQRDGKPPLSNAVGWGIHPQTQGNKILESTWGELCNPQNFAWDKSALVSLDLKEAPVTNPKRPLRLKFCFEP